MILFPFDIAVYTIIFTASIFGVYRGFVRILFDFVNFLLSIFGAYLFCPYIEDFLGKHIKDAAILSILSIIIACATSLIISSFIKSRLTNIVKNLSGNGIDKFLGLFAGFIKGNVICLIIFITIIICSSNQYHNIITTGKIIISKNKDKYPLWFSESISFKYMSGAAISLLSSLPEDVLNSYRLSTDIEQKNVPTTGDELFLPSYKDSFDKSTAK